MDFNRWEEPLCSFLWRPFRSAGRCDVWDLPIGSRFALHFSAVLCAIHVLAKAARQHLLCSGAPYLRCIRPPCWPAVSFVCDPGNQTPWCLAVSAGFYASKWSPELREIYLPEGILSGVTAQVTRTAVWSLIHWDSWGARLLGWQKAMKSDLGNNFSAVFFYGICHRLEQSVEIFEPLKQLEAPSPAAKILIWPHDKHSSSGICPELWKVLQASNVAGGNLVLLVVVTQPAPPQQLLPKLWPWQGLHLLLKTGEETQGNGQGNRAGSGIVIKGGVGPWFWGEEGREGMKQGPVAWD